MKKLLLKKIEPNYLVAITFVVQEFAAGPSGAKNEQKKECSSLKSVNIGQCVNNEAESASIDLEEMSRISSVKDIFCNYGEGFIQVKQLYLHTNFVLI